MQYLIFFYLCVNFNTTDMKKFTLIFIVAIAFMAFVIPFEPSLRTAEVNQVEGICIFTDSKPVFPYDYLGTVKDSRAVGSSKYEAIRDALIKQAKKDFPDCNGIVLDIASGTGKADAIRLK